MKDALPLAEQITQLKIGIGELLAFHSAVYEKADMGKIPLDTAAYKVVEARSNYDVDDPTKYGSIASRDTWSI